VSQYVIGGIEVKNYGTGDDQRGRVGLLNFTQLNQNLQNYRWQNLSSNMAATLLCTDFHHVSRMPTINHQKADLPVNSGRQTDSEVEADEETPTDSSRPVIELGDLTTGAEAEVNRVKSNVIALSAEISRIRSEHVGLASDYQKLTGELRDIKLVLAKVHVKELRTIERRNSWMESLRQLCEIFQRRPDQAKDQRAKNRVSSLRK
jgi:hypothetical protein